MSQTVSPSTSRCYGLARVARAWSVSRAGVYRFLKRTTSPAIPRRPGPTGPCPDADLADRAAWIQNAREAQRGANHATNGKLTRRSQPPYPWPPEQAQSGVSKPYRTTGADFRREPDDPGGEDPRAAPDPQDADRERVGPGADAGRRAGAQGQRVRDRPQASALDPRAAEWRRPRRRGADHAGRRSGTSSTTPWSARCKRAAAVGRQPEPHHAAARRGWRRRGGNPGGVPRRAEPAVRHGAAGRHVLRRQHRRRGRLPLHGGCDAASPRRGAS